VSQAGKSNGEMWAKEGFGSNLPSVKYYWVMSDEDLKQLKYMDSWQYR